MVDAVISDSKIVSAYRQKTPGSERLAAQAGELFPSGLTHDSRHLQPYGIYAVRAQGSHKWDIDGNEYIDFFGGHGALLLGHNHPQVLSAIQEALKNGTHFGANHPAEVFWAKSVQKLIPSAERVRFTSSGTEATLMAVRLARAWTGKSKIVRFKGHFHGWNDHMSPGFSSHFDGTPTVGVLPEVAERVVLLPPGDVDALSSLLTSDKDIASIMLEPTGSSFSRVPIAPSFLTTLRDLTNEHGVVLIFDEVVTGFRVSPGGAQTVYGIKPDLTTLAKILAGGLPGGAVVGRREILDVLDFEVTGRQGREKIQHQGTFNANPVSAAAGVATLEIVASGDACEHANASAATLRAELNEVMEAEDVPWAAYGTFSACHIFTNPKARKIIPSSFDPMSHDFEEFTNNRPGLVHKLRLALLINGVDIAGFPGAIVSAAHTHQDILDTADAFRESLKMLKSDGEI